MDLDSGRETARNGRWSKWWAEARSLADASSGMSPLKADAAASDLPSEVGPGVAGEISGRHVADEFHTLLSAARAYVLLMDHSFKILSASQSFRDSEISGQEPTGSNFIELLDLESQSRFRSFLETMTDRPTLIELTHWSPAEAARRVTYCFRRTGDLGQSRIIAVGRDQEDPLELVERLLRLNTELEESHQRLANDETIDPLTGLENRRRLFDRLEVLWLEASRQGTLVWVMMADLDHFKKINQTFGQEIGDELLKTIAAKLHNSVRAGDWLCRYGGDSFLLAGFCTDESEMPGLAGRTLAAIRGLRFDLGGKFPQVTISLGAALAYPSETYEPRVVLQAADRAVRRAKEAGRDRYDVEPGVAGRPEGLSAKPNQRFR